MTPSHNDTHCIAHCQDIDCTTTTICQVDNSPVTAVHVPRHYHPSSSTTTTLPKPLVVMSLVNPDASSTPGTSTTTSNSHRPHHVTGSPLTTLRHSVSHPPSYHTTTPIHVVRRNSLNAVLTQRTTAPLSPLTRSLGAFSYDEAPFDSPSAASSITKLPEGTPTKFISITPTPINPARNITTQSNNLDATPTTPPTPGLLDVQGSQMTVPVLKILLHQQRGL